MPIDTSNKSETTAFNRVLNLAMSNRSKKRRKTALLFLNSFYDGVAVSLTQIREFEDNEREDFATVLYMFALDPKQWLKEHRSSLIELQKVLNIERQEQRRR